MEGTNTQGARFRCAFSNGQIELYKSVLSDGEKLAVCLGFSGKHLLFWCCPPILVGRGSIPRLPTMRYCRKSLKQ